MDFRRFFLKISLSVLFIFLSASLVFGQDLIHKNGKAEVYLLPDKVEHRVKVKKLIASAVIHEEIKHADVFLELFLENDGKVDFVEVKFFGNEYTEEQKKAWKEHIQTMPASFHHVELAEVFTIPNTRMAKVLGGHYKYSVTIINNQKAAGEVVTFLTFIPSELIDIVTSLTMPELGIESIVISEGNFSHVIPLGKKLTEIPAVPTEVDLKNIGIPAKPTITVTIDKSGKNEIAMGEKISPEIVYSPASSDLTGKSLVMEIVKIEILQDYANEFTPGYTLKKGHISYSRRKTIEEITLLDATELKKLNLKPDDIIKIVPTKEFVFNSPRKHEIIVKVDKAEAKTDFMVKAPEGPSPSITMSLPPTTEEKPPTVAEKPKGPDISSILTESKDTQKDTNLPSILKKTDTESGVPITAGPVGLSYTVLLMDVSASMGSKSKIYQAIDIATDYVNKAGPKDRIALMKFNNSSRLLHDFNEKRGIIISSLHRLKPGGGTALRDALLDAMNVLDNAPGGRRIVYVITDGIDTASTATIDQLKFKATTLGVEIETVPVGSDAKLDVLKSISGISGGSKTKILEKR
ncbi:MAG: VWA domain-containing protein [Deltaproteobacteria bacterium]|uniref:VWA domain-containing protein n=1 Tax=Candidatus Zymogenus saltonus TaxID=2844893 RepID=A0A9D8PQ25_9DELT|nr:VWA domain-containing protein [Candidatus Zymogenus saltonus]